MLSCFRDCEEKFHIEHLLGLRPVEKSIHLIAGGAFAAGCAATRKAFYDPSTAYADFSTKQKEEHCIALGLQTLIKAYGEPVLGPYETKTIDRICSAFVYYFDTYKLSSDPIQPLYVGGKPAIEVSFAFPTGVAHPDTGEEILYAGRTDMIGVFKDICFIIDEKTTKQMGASFAKQFLLRGQFLGYAYGARHEGYNIVGSIIRGVCIRKNDFELREVGPLYTEQWKLDRWFTGMVDTLRRMVHCYKEQTWTLDLGHACGNFGGCPSMKICLAKDPTRIASEFAVVRWDPLARQEEVLRTATPFPEPGV